MNSCPISLEHLFLLIAACEGLSLWSALGGLPNAQKRKGLISSWNQTKAEILETKGWQSLERTIKSIKVYSEFLRAERIARILKSIPVLMILGLLISYTAYPVFMSRSVSFLFYCYWKWICLLIAIFSLVRLFALILVWRFFHRFENDFNSVVHFDDDDSGGDDYSVLSSL